MSYSDYYPFGVELEGRKGTANERNTHGFQGQLLDDDIKGEGNSVNYKYRMHDPRIGRFFATDPLEFGYPGNSPYAFSENRILDRRELEGLETGPTLYHGTSTGSASEIIENGFNASENGKYSNYNWFATSSGSTSGGRGSSEIFIGLQGADLSKAVKITNEQTTAWKQEIMKEMKLTGSELKKLRSTDEALYNKYSGEIYGKLYSKIGQYMDACKAEIYYLEKDGTYAMTDKVANKLARVSLKGNAKNISQLMKSRIPKAGEAKFAERVGNGRGISYGKIAGTSVFLVAAATDVYEIYTSTNKSYTITKKLYGWSTAAMGSYAATSLVAGQCGPQVALPEEVLTVPIAAFIGGMTGYFVGEEVNEYIYKFLISKGIK